MLLLYLILMCCLVSITLLELQLLDHRMSINNTCSINKIYFIRPWDSNFKYLNWYGVLGVHPGIQKKLSATKMFILSLCGLNHQIKDLLQPSICPFCNHIAFTVRFFKCFLKIMFSGGKIVWPVKKTLLHWLDAAKTTAFMWMSRRNPEMASKVLPNFSWLHFFLFSFFF